MSLVMGIDGGGSNVRIVITDRNLAVLGESYGSAVNPSIVGHETAGDRIREAMRAALDHAKLTAEQIEAVGIGVAGAAAQHSEVWLREVVSGVLPTTDVVPSSDFEIALVGARGERRGILILAGTGSAAYGVNEAGETALVGGWGYWLGDEGSGYWIGMSALRWITWADDGRSLGTQLTERLLSELHLAHPRDLIDWLQRLGNPPVQEIAALAPSVMAVAAGGDPIACQLIWSAAEGLAIMGRTAAKRLQMEKPDYAFAGGLLETPNLLTQFLCDKLPIPEMPVGLHPPVIGAALLAIQRLNKVM
jgi:N-acetylglucosamine kinase-like BadF-type ATPase